MLRSGLSWILVGWVFTTCQLAAAEPEGLAAGDYEFAFATIQQGREVLGKRDTFSAQMSPFDRQVRMQAEHDLGEKAYLKFAAAEVIEWTPTSRDAVAAAVEALDQSLQSIKLPPLQPILLIHTSGQEEGGAPYTRGNAIVIPRGKTGSKERPQTVMLAHELFHVISRQHPQLRHKLYQRIGFRHVGKVMFPKQIAERRITNPDAPTIEHVITLQVDSDSQATVAPVTYSKRDYDPASKASLFAYMDFELVEVMPLFTKSFTVKMVDGKPVAHATQPDYLRQIGRNTRYIIHPEEVLADNFSFLITGAGRVTDRWVLDAIGEVLSSGDAPSHAP
jgi:hypothetical protein